MLMHYILDTQRDTKRFINTQSIEQGINMLASAYYRVAWCRTLCKLLCGVFWYFSFLLLLVNNTSFS